MPAFPPIPVVPPVSAIPPVVDGDYLPTPPIPSALAVPRPGSRPTRAGAPAGRYGLIGTAPGLAALACFVPYLLLSAFAEPLMDAPLIGGLNTGSVLGLLQLAGFLGFAARAPRPAQPDEPGLRAGSRPAEPQR